MNLKTLNDDYESNSNNDLEMESSTKQEERDVGNHAFTQLPVI